MEGLPFSDIREINICEICAFSLDNRKKCNYSMRHSKGKEEEEYAVIADREERPRLEGVLRRRQQKVALEPEG